MGFTPREGLVIHTVAYDDGSRGRRSVAHRLSFVEMVVPYGDPKDPHYRKNAFDAGEDGLGKNCHSLRKVRVFFISCPSQIVHHKISLSIKGHVVQGIIFVLFKTLIGLGVCLYKIRDNLSKSPISIEIIFHLVYVLNPYLPQRIKKSYVTTMTRYTLQTP